MKQMIMLEQKDLHTLLTGGTLTLSVGDSQIVVGYDSSSDKLEQRLKSRPKVEKPKQELTKRGTPRKRQRYDKELKAKVMELISKPGHLKVSDIARQFNIPKRVVWTWASRGRNSE